MCDNDDTIGDGLRRRRRREVRRGGGIREEKDSDEDALMSASWRSGRGRDRESEGEIRDRGSGRSEAKDGDSGTNASVPALPLTEEQREERQNMIAAAAQIHAKKRGFGRSEIGSSISLQVLLYYNLCYSPFYFLFTTLIVIYKLTTFYLDTYSEVILFCVRH